MIEELEGLQQAALRELAAARTEEDLAALRTKYLGRKGELTAILRHIGNLSPEEKRR